MNPLQISIESLVAVVAAVVAVVVSVRGSSRTSRKDASEISALLTGIQSDIGYIKSTTNSILQRLDRAEDQTNKNTAQIIKNEATIAALEGRIRALEKFNGNK